MYLQCNEFQDFTYDEETDTLNFTPSFVRPMHIVMAAALYNYTDRNVEFKKNSDYAEVMKYKNPLEVDTYDGLHHSKAIKLKSSYDNDMQVSKVMQIFKDNGILNDSTIEALNLIIAELFSNFYDHAESEQPPICCVQDWDNGYAEISIADKGIGIEKSLKEILKDYPSISNPCRLACMNDVSSKYGKNHSGYGLFFTKRFIEENNGKLFLISGKNCYSINHQTEDDHEFPVGWKGTLIRLIINKNCSINAEELYEKIAREQMGDDYDEFF